MAQTVDQIVSAALRLLTVKQSGETLTADESADGLQSLNELIEQMNSESLFHVAKSQVTQVLSSSVQTYSFGAGATSDELIFDGGSGGTGWTGSINAGTWDFSALGKVTITSASDGDSATWDDSGTIDMTGYGDITGKVDLDTYDTSNDLIVVWFGFEGSMIGTSVNLDSYIDTSDLTEQSFTIPRADLGIEGQTIDEMTIQISVNGGTAPTVKFDDFKILSTSNSTRPLEIYTAYVVDSNTTYPCRIISNQEYSEIAFKATTSSYPYNVYYRAAYPLATMELYPVPTSSATLYLECRAALSTYTAGTDSVDLPPTYIKYLKNQLAIDISPEYREAPQTVYLNAQKAEAIIKRLNSKDKPQMHNLARYAVRTRGAY